MTTILAEVWVPGVPRTKGSLSFKGDHAEDTPQSKRWRALMAYQIKGWRARHDLVEPYTGPVSVRATFFTKGDPTSIVSGDLDKLLRNLLDAAASNSNVAEYNGGAFVDDKQVVRIEAHQVRCDPFLGPGMFASILPMDLPYIDGELAREWLLGELGRYLQRGSAGG